LLPGALWDHLPFHNNQLRPWAGFFCLAAAALVVNLAYRGPW
jgi:hypothetical protein